MSNSGVDVYIGVRPGPLFLTSHLASALTTCIFHTMRLLNTKNIQEVVEFIGEEEHPPYAILSHTWEKGEEVSLRELSDPAKCANKKGYRKIEQACAMAARNGFQY